jgi:ParB family chromosome partitioning protein
MRKNLLSVKSESSAVKPTTSLGEYARRGASRSMMLSIDEMAENVKKIAAGDVIVELDPQLVDPSFLRDRIEDDAESYALLRESIERQGQLQPVLVRPHPETPGRYMTVFGHRRARVAKELGRRLLAVVKEIEEINHIIVQGQENSRRADLTYIERSLLARKLLEMSHSKETMQSALGIDDTTLSRMLSVVSAIPAPVIEAIGAAKGVGRDRWEALKKLLLNPRKAEAALGRVRDEEFLALEGVHRFDDLLAFVKARRDKPRPPRGAVTLRSASGEAVAEMRASRHDINLKLATVEGSAFARFLESRWPGLLEEFNRVQRKE